MRRFAPVILLVACTAKSVQPDATSAVEQAPQVAAPQMGRHASTIEILGVTDEGDAAITQDVFGGTRLWPLLDGTREPVVVHLAFAKSLALGRTGNGFVAAGLDESGGLEIVALDHAGRMIKRTRIAPDPEIEDVVIDHGRVIALRADQIVVVIDSRGQTIATLPAPAGHRIQRLLTRGGHVAAVTDSAALVLEGTRWRMKSAEVHATPLPLRAGVPLGAAALSPDGKTIALELAGQVAVVGLITGGTVPPAQQPPGMFDVADLGFADNNTLVLNRSGLFEWRPVSGDGEVRTDPKVGSGAAIAWGGSLIIRGVGTSLELHAGKDVRYLGYELGAAIGMAELGRTTLPLDPRPLVDLQRLDDDHVLATREGGYGRNSLTVFNTRTRAYGVEFSSPVASQVQRYEQSTRLLALTDQTASYLVHYDTTKGKFETWYRIEYEPLDLHVLDPAKTGGAIAIAIRSDSEGKKVRAERIHTDELLVGGPIAAEETYSYTGRYLGSDERGRVYVGDDKDVIVYDGSSTAQRYFGVLTMTNFEQRLAELEAETDADGFFADPQLHREIIPMPKIGPSPKLRVVVGPGSLASLKAKGPPIAVIDHDTVSLLTDGLQRWRVTADVKDLRWIDGELVGTFAGGTANFDLATGALVARTCGQRFGFSDVPRVEAPDEESICEAR